MYYSLLHLAPGLRDLSQVVKTVTVMYMNRNKLEKHNTQNCPE